MCIYIYIYTCVYIYIDRYTCIYFKHDIHSFIIFFLLNDISFYKMVSTALYLPARLLQPMDARLNMSERAYRTAANGFRMAPGGVSESSRGDA